MTITTAPVSDNDIVLLHGIHRTLHHLIAAHEGKQASDRSLEWISRAWKEVTQAMLGILAPTFIDLCANKPHADIKAEVGAAFGTVAKQFADSAVSDVELLRYGFYGMDRAIYARALELRADHGVTVAKRP